MEELLRLESTIDKMRSAIEHCDVAGVRAQLAAGYRPDTLIRDRYTALHLAVPSRSAMELLPMLVDAGFDVNAYDTNGQTPLHWALERHAPLDVVKFLIGAGANVAVRDNMEATLIQHAAQVGNIELCGILLDAGVDMTAPDKHSCTPLHMAAWNDHLAICKLLVDAGASPSWTPDLVLDDYLTPFQLAVKHGVLSVARYFVVECREDIDQRTVDGRTMQDLVAGNQRAAAMLAQLTATIGTETPA